MANIIRGPLYVGRREVPLQTAVVFVALSSLLTTTLATAPIPIGVQSFPVQVQRYVQLGADTTQDSPQTLRPDAQAPVGAVSYVATPAPVRIPASTAVGSAKSLTADKQAPVGAQSSLLPDLVRPVTDTTRGTGKILTADLQQPVGSVAYVTTPRPVRLGSETSQPSALSALQALVPAPFVPLPIALLDARLQLSLAGNTSAGSSPLVLDGVAVVVPVVTDEGQKPAGKAKKKRKKIVLEPVPAEGQILPPKARPTPPVPPEVIEPFVAAKPQLPAVWPLVALYTANSDVAASKAALAAALQQALDDDDEAILLLLSGY